MIIELLVPHNQIQQSTLNNNGLLKET